MTLQAFAKGCLPFAQHTPHSPSQWTRLTLFFLGGSLFISVTKKCTLCLGRSLSEHRQACTPFAPSKDGHHRNVFPGRPHRRKPCSCGGQNQRDPILGSAVFQSVKPASPSHVRAKSRVQAPPGATGPTTPTAPCAPSRRRRAWLGASGTVRFARLSFTPWGRSLFNQ